MSKKLNDVAGGGGDPTQSSEALAAAETERVRQENETKERDVAARKAADEAAAAEGLITVTKGDETLKVHPTCVASHKAAGWKAVE